MISERDAQALARQFADAATADDAAAWASGSQALAGLDGRSWLLLDQAARSFRYAGDAPVSGATRWLGASLSEPSGFVAAVMSLHVDGRFRERAVEVLGTAPGVIAVPALASRLLDHVPEIRALAWEVLRPRVGIEAAEALLDVLLAGVTRHHARAALREVEAALLATTPPDDLVATLTGSERRRVRRWAFEFGHHRSLLAPEQLVAATRADSDQWVRARCAEWLAQEPDSRVLVRLLEAPSVEARQVALRQVPEGDLSDDALAARLVDRAPRVREQARHRARARRLDLAEFYRQRLAEEGLAPHLVAACMDGLALTGDETDLQAAVTHLRHPSARVRSAAIATVEARAPRNLAVDLLTPMLLDSSPRVCATAARELARLGAPPSTAEAAWASDQPSSRRVAWRVARAAGGWHRVEADLRAAVDPDPVASAAGHTGIRNWLAVGAATTWQPLPDSQRERLEALLSGSDFSRETRRLMAFHLGLEPPAEEQTTRPTQDLSATATTRARRWLRLFGRR